MTEMPLSQLSHLDCVHRCLLGRARDIDGGVMVGGLAAVGAAAAMGARRAGAAAVRARGAVRAAGRARQGRRCGGCGGRVGGTAGRVLRPCELAARWVPLGGRRGMAGGPPHPRSRGRAALFPLGPSSRRGRAPHSPPAEAFPWLNRASCLIWFLRRSCAGAVCRAVVMS